MLSNEILRGKTVATPYGEVVFDMDGFSTSLTVDEQKELASKVYTYVYIEDEKPKVEKPKKEEPKKEEPKVEKPKEEKPSKPKKTATKTADKAKK